MSSEDRLFLSFSETLNRELEALGCKLRIEKVPSSGSTMCVMAASGRRLGNLPDHVDAEALAAFEKILSSCCPST